MNDLVEKICGLSQSAAIKLHVRSALNPMLWLCSIATPFCLFFAYLFRDYSVFSIVLIVVGLFPVVITCLAFIGFAIFRPEKLQSEDYQIRHESLQVIQSKTGRIQLSPTSIEAIANPNIKQLASKENDNVS